MNDRELREQLKDGRVHNQYLFIGTEPLLIENAVKAIKNTLKVDESFDYDSFSISETSVDDIVSKLYLSPFASTRRLVVIKNLEELDTKELGAFADAINVVRTNNCVILTYITSKEYQKYNNYKRIANKFPHAEDITFIPDKKLIHRWIVAKIKKDNLNLSTSMIHYLEEEFSNDITGLKNEFDKIENYLHEAKSLNPDSMKDLAQGLCDFNKYHLVDTFLDGKPETFACFEELRPYLRSYAEIVDALTRGILNHIQRKGNVNETVHASAKGILDEVTDIDRKVKTSSFFVHLLLELLILHRLRLYAKGAVHGS
jgi:DNA polymerase III delta subunit